MTDVFGNPVEIPWEFFGVLAVAFAPLLLWCLEDLKKRIEDANARRRP